MRGRNFWIGLLGVTWTLLGVSIGSIRAAETPPAVEKLGKAISLPPLTDVAGQPVALDKDPHAKLVAVVFLSFECPVANSYIDPLNQLAQKYADRGVKLLGVIPGEEAAGDLRKSVQEFQFRFPVVADPKLQLADLFKATITPEVFVLDHNRVLRYRGRIDNTWAARLRKNASTTEYELRNALDELLAGKPVTTPATKSIGCPVRQDTSGTPITTKVTYYKDILPILQTNCQSCHRPGEVGPFSLMTYKQAVNWASDIEDYTHSGKMPPWKPTTGPAFENERRLSDKELNLISEWVKGGTPAGDPKDAPKPAVFTEGWQLGKPDLVLTVQDDFHVGPSGNDTFRCFVLPTNLKEDVYVVAVDVRPGNPSVVHHTLNFFDTSGTGRKLEAEARLTAKPGEQDHGPGYSVAMGVGFRPAPPGPDGKPTFGGVGGWAPGQMPHLLPEGYGYFLPAGSDMLVQVHYHRNGKPEKDRTSIGLYFAKKPKMKAYRTVTVGGEFLVIPPGASEFKAKGTRYLDRDCLLHSVLPHMHLLGKSVKVTITPPNSEPITLVGIDDWDYNWQETYWFRKPIPVKAGTKLEIEAIYDNSNRNPNNPSNPPRWVKVGEQTTDEMLFGFVGATTPDGSNVRLLRVPPTPIPAGTPTPKPGPVGQ
ncbi:redoxin domain-containing protein [Tuwongella immobilis]|uniref:Thioredoxin domain-containing protein n=1 Tax=Tuwongella immobilis TaxID=692036 RepID=A0A6C2YKH3_9BACT|nr:redoxin domain-containing protein [Tuwongella immobilis]VIP01729.1 peroxiredoxin : Peroxiredoxin OS=Singulisphaera acidiphila (strain ATCC BAA-1392 / DSM 18658 / VKM B-2454 / MOB10) GN=Sinac_5965 PE=4 SV=1: AhpC-TSA: Cu2_monoox_C [Tuwongella immobilis]VTR99275.1 peroxiredoxin : Peroxiredoxin OS=Singulisphaera acidiphila (strain ATCC BAA-1392 / DSM 18658 / VKM B-2454 / MOB10) GN=Sinac_5965 PE=4 SV=1: AhpC-TSA: Cu2_monoox_C [Tuwongella immobilis]